MAIHLHLHLLFPFFFSTLVLLHSGFSSRCRPCTCLFSFYLLFHGGLSHPYSSRYHAFMTQFFIFCTDPFIELHICTSGLYQIYHKHLNISQVKFSFILLPILLHFISIDLVSKSEISESLPVCYLLI